MLKKIKVKMPNNGCVARTFNSSVYIYYATDYFRNEDGKPRTTRVLIGKKDEASGMLIPNDNYFDLFSVEIIIKERSVKNDKK